VSHPGDAGLPRRGRVPLVALDVTRMALAPVRRAPRGIDRVELAYGRHFLHRWPGRCVGVLPTAWGVRVYDRATLLRGLAAIEALWRETIAPDEDPILTRAKAFLAGEDLPALPRRSLKPGIWEQARGFFRLYSNTGILLGHSAARMLPESSIYLNVGQLEVFAPALAWLNRRPDVLSVFMIHDVIPLELPEHHTPFGIAMHERIVRNTARFARALIAPSHAAGVSVRRAVAPHGNADRPIYAGTLPPPPEFLVPAARDPVLEQARYFVVSGVIDAYKNHLLLLEVWKTLVARQGLSAPRLVIAGSPGVTGGAVLAWIERHPELRSHVLLAAGLSTGAMHSLVAHADALLMPSLAEGFGLPIVEALAQGTPVIASDIAAHREAGAGGDVTYLPPTDREAWLAAIAAFSGRADVTMNYRPKLWDDYFTELTAFLLAQTDASRSKTVS